jgi:hypothetical protein
MKTKNKFSRWCKITLMLPAVAVMLTFTSCQKDDLLSGSGLQFDDLTIKKIN